MELYKFFWGALAWMATVAALFPANIPLLALAYKIQNGAKPLPIERDELWYRSAWGAFMLALATLAFVFVNYVILDYTDFPPGPIHLVFFMAYVPAAAWILMYYSGSGELLDGLGLFVIYVGLPILVLFVLNALLGIWNLPLNFAYDWLKAPV